jgi:hypothetical protein
VAALDHGKTSTHARPTHHEREEAAVSTHNNKKKRPRQPLAERINPNNQIDPNNKSQTLAEIVAAKEAKTPPSPPGVQEHAWPKPRGPPPVAGFPTLLKFADLKALGLVNNYGQLKHLLEAQGFPPGFWLSNNVHVWDSDVVLVWLRNRPSERPERIKHEGAPRKRKSKRRQQAAGEAGQPQVGPTAGAQQTILRPAAG